MTSAVTPAVTIPFAAPPAFRLPFTRAAGAVLLAALSVAANADVAHEEARSLLERMAHASRSLDYIGTFVYRSGSTMQSMKIVHRADAQGSRERLVALSGAAREVIREGQRVICILPDDQAVIFTAGRPGTPGVAAVFGSGLQLGEGVDRIYSLSSSGDERVADREATVIEVRPKDRYRYGFRFAVDRHSGLLLKSELLDDDSRALEQIIYTHLELPDSIPDAALEPRIAHDGFVQYGFESDDGVAAGETDSGQEWAVGWLPEGFRLTSELRRPIHRGHAPVVHRVYSDGLVSISVFIEQVPEAHHRFEGRYSAGAVNAFGRVVDEYQISVVGEVPAITATKVAASVVKE